VSGCRTAVAAAWPRPARPGPGAWRGPGSGTWPV